MTADPPVESLRDEKRRGRLIRLGWFAVAVLGVLVLGALVPTLVRLLQTDPFSDVRAYYNAAARLNAGGPLYPADADVNAPDFYRYPPLLAIVFRPMALLSYEVAAAIWEAFMVVFLVLTVRRLAPRGAVLRALAILAFPIAWSVALGQAQVLVTWLLTVGSPWSVALAGQLKVFPALVAVYWLGRRDWRSVRGFVAWSFGLIALQFVLEPTGSIEFLKIANLSQVGQVNNLSVYAISPELWAGLVVLGFIAALALAPTRYGWAAAVSVSVLATPRLLSYLLMAFLAVLRYPASQRARA